MQNIHEPEASKAPAAERNLHQTLSNDDDDDALAGAVTVRLCVRHLANVGRH